MIEPSSRGQASVVFLGRSSFRMETAGEAPIADELAIPARASEIPTERIFRSRDERSFFPVAPPPTDIRPSRAVSRGALIGFGLVTFAFGSLMTSAAVRSHLWFATDPKSEVAPGQAPPPPAASPTEPIVVAVAPPVTESPAPAPVIAKFRRAPRLVRLRAAGATPNGPQTEAVDTDAPPAPRAAASADVAPAVAKKWVDPFAD